MKKQYLPIILAVLSLLTIFVSKFVERNSAKDVIFEGCVISFIHVWQAIDTKKDTNISCCMALKLWRLLACNMFR